MRLVKTLVVMAVLGLFAGACGGDDDDGGGNAFPGVSTWKCYTFGAESCECVGLGPGDQYDASGNNVVEVTSCPATLSVCQTFKDGFDDWLCECRAAAWVPDDASTAPASAAKCPP
jgi:hypothetical protein